MPMPHFPRNWRRLNEAASAESLCSRGFIYLIHEYEFIAFEKDLGVLLPEVQAF